MNPDKLNIAIIQAQLAWGDKKSNIDYFSRELSKLSGNIDLIVLPEMFATGFVTDVLDHTESMEGSVISWMKDKAASINAVITGSVAIEEDDSIYNRLIWMRPDGTFEQYDKRHLFRMGNEHLKFSQGSNSPVFELKGWKIKPLVCYDLRFPVWSKNRLVNDQYQYDILVYVANWPASRCFAWNTLLAARAIENQSYCIGVNRIGEDGKGIPHRGGSVILDFKGKLIKACEDNKAETVTATIDYKSLLHFRETFRVALDWDQFTITP